MKYTYTSAEAAKALRRLNEDCLALCEAEVRGKEFVAAVGEDTESLRPDYDYAETQKKLDEYDAKIRALKHAINVFNTTHIVPGFDMTIDAMLVYIPQLSARKKKLMNMKACMPKTRVQYHGNSSIIDYSYINYDLNAVEEDYNKVSDLLSKAQTALDYINNTETMEVEL